MEGNASMTRRGVLAMGVGVAGAALTASAMGTVARADEVQGGQAANDIPSFLVKPEPITDFAQTHDYDVVVVGAGASGLAAANAAHEAGAKVAVVQKLDVASSQGYEAAGLLADENDEAAKQAFVSQVIRLCDFRPKRELLDAWAHTSGEAIKWWRGLLTEAQVEINAEDEGAYERDCNGYTVKFIKAGPTVSYAGAVPALADWSAGQGIDFFFGMPAVQLVGGEDGRVTGVIAGSESAYELFNAAKAVIISTGDYQCNDEMIAYYCPDVLGFPPLEAERTGDGHRMGVWAGGHIEQIGHTKMIHDIWSNSAPYMKVGPDGKRFCDENVPWFKLNTLMRDLVRANIDQPSEARIFSIVDDDYMQQAEEWSAINPDVTPEEIPSPEITTLGDYPISYQADTIEELAELINIDPSSLAETVARYNELVEAGADEDFGKDARYLAPIAKAPFHAVQHDFNWGLSATLGGLVVNGSNQVLDDNDEPIPGLYATGNASGPFFGGIDYPMYFPGLSIGRAVTTGYIAGRAAAAE